MQDKSFRHLTTDEISAVPAPLAAGIDLTKVEIHRRRWTPLTPPRTTVARGYRIYWPNAGDEARQLSHLAHLVHEITHVWQYKYLGVGMYSPRWLDRRYGYSLDASDYFFRFGLEQQASIIEDSVLMRHGHPPRRARISPKASVYELALKQITTHQK